MGAWKVCLWWSQGPFSSDVPGARTGLGSQSHQVPLTVLGTMLCLLTPAVVALTIPSFNLDSELTPCKERLKEQHPLQTLVPVLIPSCCLHAT